MREKWFCFSTSLLHAENRTEFVAVWIAHVSQVHSSQGAFAQSGWILNRLTTVLDGYVVELLNLLGGTALESDRAAVSKSGYFPVDWLRDAKSAPIVAIEKAGVSRRRRVAQRLGCSKRSQHCVVKELGPFNVV